MAFLPTVDMWKHEEAIRSGEMVLTRGQWVQCGPGPKSRFVAVVGKTIRVAHGKDGNEVNQRYSAMVKALKEGEQRKAVKKAKRPTLSLKKEKAPAVDLEQIGLAVTRAVRHARGKWGLGYKSLQRNLMNVSNQCNLSIVFHEGDFGEQWATLTGHGLVWAVFDCPERDYIVVVNKC